MKAESEGKAGTAGGRATRRRIILVDDHPVVGKGIGSLLHATHEFELAGQAVNVVEAMELIKTCNPDLVLLDLSLPGPGGLELLKNLQVSHPDLPILVLSMFDKTPSPNACSGPAARGM